MKLGDGQPCVFTMFNNSLLCNFLKCYERKAPSVTKLIHETFVELCQAGDNGRNLVLLRQDGAPKMPGARYLFTIIKGTTQISEKLASHKSSDKCREGNIN